MKFGKLIAQEQNLAWNSKWLDFYMNYKRLKSIIRLITELDWNKPDEATEKLTEYIQGMMGDNSKKDEASQTPTTTLTARESGGSGNGTNLVPQTPNVTAATKKRFSLADGFFDARQKIFVSLLRRDLHKVDNFLRFEFANLKGKILKEKTDHEAGLGPDKAVANSTLRKSLVGYKHTLDNLEGFLHINYNAFEKIIKKFDKKVVIEELDIKLSPTLAPHVVRIFDTLRSKAREISEIIDNLIEMYGKPTAMEETEAMQSHIEALLVEDIVPTYRNLNLSIFSPESVNRLKIMLGMDGTGEPISVPVIVCKGKFDGPVLGITAALHGNELNGIPIIHRLMREVNVEGLAGTLVAIPVLNVPGYLRHQREYMDGNDLNRIFPGKSSGSCSQCYCHNIMQKIVSHFDYHIDLHTASFGRINSLYVRADMNNKVTHAMAKLQDPQIIVHNTSPDGSLRGAAMKQGIPSITVEVGDPSIINRGFVKSAFLGVENIMAYLDMTDDDIETSENSTVCSKSYWLFCNHGGLLTVIPAINTWVEKDQVIARVRNMFGDVTAIFRAPEDGIVVGKSVNPVCHSGDRILHLGVIDDHFDGIVNDGH